MIVEIRPGPTSNKGGELMLRAVVRELGGEHQLAVEPWIGPYRMRAELGLLQKLWVRRLGPAAGLPGWAMPRRARRLYGLVTEREIGGVLDASGYAFADHFPDERMRSIAATLGRFASAGKPAILLPQAFGPLERPAARDAARRAVASARMVFARDESSRRHLEAVGAPLERVRVAPDFTGSIPGRPPVEPERWARRVAIVPNVMMTTATEAQNAGTYLAFLVETVRAVRAADHEPIVVLHESSADRQLADELAERSGGLEIVGERDPLALKGVLAACRLVVASRFHAIAGALSSGVPVLATGWSHKYEALLAGYGVPDLLVSTDAEAASLRELLVPLLDGPARRDVLQRLDVAATRIEAEVRTMWVAVRAELGSAPAT